MKLASVYMATYKCKPLLLLLLSCICCNQRVSSQSCGCNSPDIQLCTSDVLNTMAGEYTCGARINYLINSEGYAELDACRQVAGKEFPCACGACNPDKCWDVTNPATVRTVAPTLPPIVPPTNLYCFPEENSRVTFLDMWNDGGGGSYKVQVKEGSICGPGNNRFTKDTVSIATGDDKLAMQLKKNLSSGVWEASEVRIVNSDGRPFKYGNYTFFVESVAVKNGEGQTISEILPANIVLGLFTWDPTDRYEVHENWNHEVDIEISRWGNDGNADTQFLMQPPKSPQMYRFFSGSSPNTYEQSNHWHSFRWLPNEISWLSTAGGGQSHLYTTENAVLSGCEDYVQCLPADVEIRINLWNTEGIHAAPRGLLNDDDYVEVVIGNFIYEEAGIDFAAPGDYCSKHCQCEAPEGCVDGRCVEITPSPVVSTPSPIASTPAPVVSTPSPIASTHAPMASTQAPVDGPTSDCEIKSQVENIETKVESMEINIQNLEIKLAGIENTADTILSLLQMSTTASPISTPAPVSTCTDRTGVWERIPGSKERNWCTWAKKDGPDLLARRCELKNMVDDCPLTCDNCHL